MLGLLAGTQAFYSGMMVTSGLCRYSKALDAALQTQRIAIVASLIDELASREGLTTAIAGRSAPGLLPLMRFLSKYVAHPVYSKVAMATVSLCLDLHGGMCISNHSLLELLDDLRGRVVAEVRLQKDMQGLRGVLDMLAYS
jgi:U3 small nucleolar RNA-associated protein 15